MAAPKIPKYICKSLKAWRILKRREWRDVATAFDTFRMGCFYTPVYPDVEDFELAVRQMHDRLRGNWEPKPDRKTP